MINLSKAHVSILFVCDIRRMTSSAVSVGVGYDFIAPNSYGLQLEEVSVDCVGDAKRREVYWARANRAFAAVTDKSAQERLHGCNSGQGNAVRVLDGEADQHVCVGFVGLRQAELGRDLPVRRL